MTCLSPKTDLLFEAGHERGQVPSCLAKSGLGLSRVGRVYSALNITLYKHHAGAARSLVLGNIWYRPQNKMGH